MPLRRLGGLSVALCSRFRRGLSTAAASRPELAMLFRAPLVRSPAPRPSLQLLEPPSASRLTVPPHLLDPRPEPSADYSDNRRRFHGGFVHAASGDGLLLLDFMDIRDMDLLTAGNANARAVQLGCEFGPEDPDILRLVCNPVSGEMFRLPDTGGTKKVLALQSHGLLTHSAQGHGPPDRYVVAQLKVELYRYSGALVLTVRRFLSQTGKRDKLVCSERPRGLRVDRGMTADHEVLAFAGWLWWVDVSWGALSVDPFSDRPDFRFVKLPKGSAIDCVEVPRDLGRYRRMGVSEGKLRYAEVTREEPFALSSFVLDNDSGTWTLEHRMALSLLRGVRPRQEHAPHIAVVDPLNASVMHIAIGNIAFAVDMDKEKVLGCSTSPIDQDDDGLMEGLMFFQPCLLPPWLGSSPVPSAGTLSSGKTNVKSNTLSDILVRVDRSRKN